MVERNNFPQSVLARDFFGLDGDKMFRGVCIVCPESELNLSNFALLVREVIEPMTSRPF